MLGSVKKGPLTQSGDHAKRARLKYCVPYSRTSRTEKQAHPEKKINFMDKKIAPRGFMRIEGKLYLRS